MIHCITSVLLVSDMISGDLFKDVETCEELRHWDENSLMSAYDHYLSEAVRLSTIAELLNLKYNESCREQELNSDIILKEEHEKLRIKLFSVERTTFFLLQSFQNESSIFLFL